jgi:hypothetical protein
MITYLKWLMLLFISGLFALGGICMHKLTSAPRNEHFSSFIKNIQNKPMLVVWVNGSCPLSRQYAPHLKHCISIAKGHQWNTLLISVNDSVCDPLFQDLKAEYYRQDVHGTLAQRFNISVIPSVMVYRNTPVWQEPTASLAYRAAIDNWAWETGKHRLAATEHYLVDAMTSMASGKNIEKAHTKSYGCFIEINQ